MSLNTAALVAGFQAFPPVPADGRERSAVEQIKALAGRRFQDYPQLDAKAAGYVLMHVAQLHDELIQALRESDPALDWESLATLAHNIIGVAGMELYTGTELGAPEMDTIVDPQGERGECEGCGCCSRAGCNRLADSTCPTNSLGDSVCPCTED